MNAVIGLDISLNHTGFVALDMKTNKVCHIAYITDKKKFEFDVLKVSQNPIIRNCFTTELNKLKKKTNNLDTITLIKVRTTKKWILKQLSYLPLSDIIVTHIAIEGFSFASQSNSIYQIGGLVEGLKSIFYNRNILMRIYSPKTIQSWANVSQSNHKLEMIETAIENGFDELSDKKLLEVKKQKSGKLKVDCPASDLADAYWLASMLRIELLIRAGKIALSDLTDKQRRLFLTTTQSRKTNYLNLDFIGELHEEVF